MMSGYLLQVQDPLNITDKKEYNKKICKEQFKKIIEYYIDNGYGKEEFCKIKHYWNRGITEEKQEEQEIELWISYLLGLTDHYNILHQRFNEIEVGMFIDIQFKRYRDWKESLLYILSEYESYKQGHTVTIETLHEHMKSIRNDLILYKKCFNIYDSVEKLFNHLKATEPMLKRYNECLDLYKQNFKEAKK